MADPVAIVSVAVSLIDIGTKLASKIKAFVDNFSDAPNDVDRVWDELSSLCLILGRVEKMLRNSSASYPPFTPEIVADLRLLLDHTMKVFIQFEKFVNDFSSQGTGSQLSGRYQQGQWALAEKHITNFRDMLVTHKASLNISLQLGTLSVAQHHLTPSIVSNSHGGDRLATANIAQVVGNIQANTETTNTELTKLRAMCQELLDRERIVSKDSSVNVEDPSNNSETSSVIITFIERTELFAEELVAPQGSSTSAQPVAVTLESCDQTEQQNTVNQPENNPPATAEDPPYIPKEGHEAPPAVNVEPKSMLEFHSQHLAGDQKLHNEQLVKSAINGDRATIERLLLGGVNVNSLWRGHTALQRAVENGHGAIVQILLDSGADVNAGGYLTPTALQLADRMGYKSIVRLLVNYGANFDDIGRFSQRHSRYSGHRGAVGDALFRQTFSSLKRLTRRLCCCSPAAKY